MLGAKVGLMITERADAGAIDIALQNGVTHAYLDPRDHVDRAAHDRAMADAIDGSGCDLVVMAGYMRLVSDEFIERFRGRIVNVHPSLLPAFPGASAIADALAYGVKVVGVTVHFVTEKMDSGPIILQRSLAVEEGEGLESLSARIHEVEHELYPRALQLIVEDALSVDGRIVTIGSTGQENPSDTR